MHIQWFPGHMHRTRQVLAARVKHIDVVIEMLDARLPGSSSNPLLHAITSGKLRLKVLSKQDLADPQRTAAWLAWYQGQDSTDALALHAGQSAPARRLIAACRALATQRGSLARPLRVLICGVPNVGKSTLINAMSGKKHAATGDEAGITKQEARIVLADDFYLWDTPGMLWPRINAAQSGLNLAASGAVGRNAYDAQQVALHLLDYLQTHYASAVHARWHVPAGTHDSAALLEQIGRQRGAVLGGGHVNLHRAAELVLADLRGGALGRVTLETPDEFARWQALALAPTKPRLRRYKSSP